MDARLRNGIGAVLLVGAACAILLWEPWHGPAILTLSASHGVDTGDLPALVLFVWAVALLRPGRRARTPGGSAAWTDRTVGALAAVVLGVLLILAGVSGKSGGGPLVPSGGGTFDGSTPAVSAGRATPQRRWSHLAVTYDGDELCLYVNGAAVSDRAMSGALRRSKDPLWIGGNMPYGEYFAGLIDEVRVYDRALGPAELRAEMATPI